MRVKLEANQDRIKSALGAAAFHAVLGYALVTGLGVDVAGEVSDTLKLFDVRQEPPPPPVEEPAPAAKTEAEEGAASPPDLKARPAPVVAPPPEIRLEVPPPIVAAPIAGQASDPDAGAAPVVGPGTGSGGVGTGTGSGAGGDGTGGGVAVESYWLSGSLRGLDYPSRARRSGAGGSVTVRYWVEIDGSVTGCTITKSSGNAELDQATCGLIERRFRYEPARDAQGRLVRDVSGGTHVWWTEPRRRSRDRRAERPRGDRGYRY